MRTIKRAGLTLALCVCLTSLAVAGPNGNANGHANSNGGGNGGNKSSEATPKSAVRQYALANGLKQGEVASMLKSWNSLNANEKAFINNFDNPASLHGKQVSYICATVASESALSDFAATGGDPENPPSEAEFLEATAFIDATALLAGADPSAVLLDSESTPDEIVAANLVLTSSLDLTTAQTVVVQYDAWQIYEAATSAADDSFVVASVSYKGADPESLADLRSAVDGVIAQKGLAVDDLCP